MFEIFSDIFACRENALTRIDPRPKLVIGLSLILAVILSRRIALPVTVAAVCVGTMLYLKIPAKLVLIRLLGPMGIVAVLVILKTFVTEGTPLAAFSLAGHSFAATREGFWLGMLLGSRVLGAVSVVFLLSSVTPAHRIFNALRWFRVPEGWVEIALLMYRYVFALVEHAADVASAQRIRLGYSSIRRSFVSIGVLAGTVVTQSMEQAGRTYEAMMIRCYQGAYPFGPLPKLKTSDCLFMAIVPPLIAGVYVLVEWG